MQIRPHNLQPQRDLRTRGTHAARQNEPRDKQIDFVLFMTKGIRNMLSVGLYIFMGYFRKKKTAARQYFLKYTKVDYSKYIKFKKIKKSTKCFFKLLVQVYIIHGYSFKLR